MIPDDTAVPLPVMIKLRQFSMKLIKDFGYWLKMVSGYKGTKSFIIENGESKNSKELNYISILLTQNQPVIQYLNKKNPSKKYIADPNPMFLI